MNEAEALRREIDFLEKQISAKRNMLIRLETPSASDNEVNIIHNLLFADNSKMLDVKAQKGAEAVKEVLKINSDRLLFLLKDVSDGYYFSTATEREIVKDCLNLALALKKAKSINIQY